MMRSGRRATKRNTLVCVAALQGVASPANSFSKELNRSRR